MLNVNWYLKWTQQIRSYLQATTDDIWGNAIILRSSPTSHQLTASSNRALSRARSSELWPPLAIAFEKLSNDIKMKAPALVNETLGKKLKRTSSRKPTHLSLSAQPPKKNKHVTRQQLLRPLVHAGLLNWNFNFNSHTDAVFAALGLMRRVND